MAPIFKDSVVSGCPCPHTLRRAGDTVLVTESTRAQTTAGQPSCLTEPPALLQGPLWGCWLAEVWRYRKELNEPRKPLRLLCMSISETRVWDGFGTFPACSRPSPGAWQAEDRGGMRAWGGYGSSSCSWQAGAGQVRAVIESPTSRLECGP